MSEQMAIDASVLDDVARRAALDAQNMIPLTHEFPEQCRRALEIARQFNPPTPRLPIHNVVVTGLGGSAVGGDLLRVLVEDSGEMPVVVNRDYQMPAFVNDHTFVIAASYSGNTEETLSAFEDAQDRGALLACITSGGELAQRAAHYSAPVAFIPKGQPPRSAMGYLFIPMLLVAHKAGVIRRDPTPELEQAIALLERAREAWHADVPLVHNPAKQFAARLYGKLPIIYGSQAYSTVVAFRWKTQLNENAKIHAFSNGYPEMNHNEILGWVLAKQQVPNLAVVLLRDHVERPKIVARVETTKRLFARAAEVHEFFAEGQTLLARMLYAIYFGDWVSCYLALLYGMNPTDISYINLLKAVLEKVDEDDPTYTEVLQKELRAIE
ncbi:MAG: bifunctional phosphoglucose/phosphomannose isomerase [Armatimonadetes bacterium]|nr:bifunctional phosphoglucose/phosphomannose isomerase [Armatimonadota bacterium]